VTFWDAFSYQKIMSFLLDSPLQHVPPPGKPLDYDLWLHPRQQQQQPPRPMSGLDEMTAMDLSKIDLTLEGLDPPDGAKSESDDDDDGDEESEDEDEEDEDNEQEGKTNTEPHKSLEQMTASERRLHAKDYQISSSESEKDDE
jgi:hypothetical protein